MFDILSSSELLLNEYINNEFPIELPSSSYWKEYDLAHIYLQLNDYDKSKEIFLSAQRDFMQVGFDMGIGSSKKM